MQIDLSDAEYATLCRAAACLGVTPECLAELAVSKVIEARYVLPKQPGTVVVLKSLKRGEP